MSVDEERQIRRLIGESLELEVHPAIPTYRDHVGCYDALDLAEFRDQHGNQYEYPGPGKWK